MEVQNVSQDIYNYIFTMIIFTLHFKIFIILIRHLCHKYFNIRFMYITLCKVTRSLKSCNLNGQELINVTGVYNTIPPIETRKHKYFIFL